MKDLKEKNSKPQWFVNSVSFRFTTAFCLFALTYHGRRSGRRWGNCRHHTGSLTRHTDELSGRLGCGRVSGGVNQAWTPSGSRGTSGDDRISHCQTLVNLRNWIERKHWFVTVTIKLVKQCSSVDLAIVSWAEVACEFRMESNRYNKLPITSSYQ